MARTRTIYSGDPGTVWTNETGTVQFQFFANWQNTCGVCAQFDSQIGASWPIPLHRGCKCHQVLVAPGQESQPFTDFRATIATLDPVQQSRVVGRSNLDLINKGVVTWDDVVTRTRVRDLREVVSRHGLSVKELVKAGVNPRIAEEAFATVHTPAHQLAEAKRKELLAQLTAKGIEAADIRKALAERLAARVGITSGPSGPGASPIVPATPKPLPPFVPSLAAKDQRMKTVWVDVLKLDEAFQRDVGYAIGPGGVGAIPGRLEGFKRFFRTASTEGIAIEQSQVVVSKDGDVSFIDGRHRFSVLRDRGVKRLPVSVPRHQVNRVKRFFGVDPPEELKFQSASEGVPVSPLPAQPQASPAATRTAPILPGKPIAERIAAWDEGKAKIGQLQALASNVASARKAEAEQKARLEELAAAYKDAPKGAAKKAAKAAKEQADGELLLLGGKAAVAERAAREAAQFILDAPRRLHLGLSEATPERLSEYQLDSTREGMRWLQRCVSHPEETGQMTLNITAVPDSEPQRSACGPYFMTLSKSVSPAVVVHETGHHFDYKIAGVDAAAREFLAYRVGDEQPTQLRTVLDGKFDADEHGKKDRFDEAFGDAGWYAGKAYPSGSTEITAMGIEKMFTDPVGFATKDPEFAQLILGLMHGPLR